MPSDPSALVMTSWDGACTAAGRTAGAMIGLPAGRPCLARTGTATTPARIHAHDGAYRAPASKATATRTAQTAAGRPRLAALLVDPQVIGQQAVSGGLVLEPVEVGGMPPGQDPAADAEQPDDRPGNSSVR
jgi:hypothetical protein